MIATMHVHVHGTGTVLLYLAAAGYPDPPNFGLPQKNAAAAEF